MAAWSAAASFAESAAILELCWYSTLMSALGLCLGPGGMPWSNIIMSCWMTPSHFGSAAVPCSFDRSSA
jgi:hypothetical protein